MTPYLVWFGLFIAFMLRGHKRTKRRGDGKAANGEFSNNPLTNQTIRATFFLLVSALVWWFAK